MESKYLRYDMDKWKDVNASNYESKAFWDKKWIEVGIDLLESSRLLKQKINEVWESRIQLNKDPSTVLITDHYHGVYLMLIAYAVENLFKAVIVKNNSARFRQQFKRDKKFPAILKKP